MSFIADKSQKGVNMTSANGSGGAASQVKEIKNATFNVVDDYRWTLSERRKQEDQDGLNEVPYIILYEYKIDESIIRTQLKYYFDGFFGSFASDLDSLEPYKNLFPRPASGNPENIYQFPYFSDINFELNTPEWQSLDTLEQGQKFASGIMGTIFGEGGAKATNMALDLIGKGAGAYLGAAYPKVGIMDRPKLWQNHQFRSFNIKFPLFNTYGPNDWKQNRDLCWTLVNQNLFTKRNLIVGYPPCYYEFLIPGVYYSFASAVTNLTIYNRGNMRRLVDNRTNEKVIVPDVYEIDMTLTDMVMPSRNLFQQVRQKQDEITVRTL
jgi:hypothetical protein